jgi:uncharacterized protein YeaO (DUF488 family)
MVGVKRRAIRLKRVYDPPGPEDGLRVLVDGLWPRGLSRRAVSADLWLKEAAPSSALRRWYGHDPRRWQAFCRKYRTELARRPEILRLIDDLRRRAPVTLLFGARDAARNNAVVLREMLDKETLDESR